jgi:site-specific recombinase XerD
MKSLPVTVAIEGFLLECSARRLSPNTLAWYSHILAKLIHFLPADPPIADITKAQLETFLASLTTLGNKSLLGHHAALSSLWRWAEREGLVERNIVRDIPEPEPEQRIVNPFTQSEIKAMLAAVDKSAPYTRQGQREMQHTMPGAPRNRAILYLLLDTGIRASELCNLRLRDLDMKAHTITVNGKGNKERQIPFSDSTAKILWRYLSGRKTESVDVPLFPSLTTGHELDARDLYHLIVRIARRAGVADAHPHRFRHTFAIQFLRNHGDVYTLQRILGHTTLDMVRRYLAIAQTDIEAAHRLASPVANWRL